MARGRGFSGWTDTPSNYRRMLSRQQFDRAVGNSAEHQGLIGHLHDEHNGWGPNGSRLPADVHADLEEARYFHADEHEELGDDADHDHPSYESGWL